MWVGGRVNVEMGKRRKKGTQNNRQELKGLITKSSQWVDEEKVFIKLESN